jgi:hypothetical protein
MEAPIRGRRGRPRRILPVDAVEADASEQAATPAQEAAPLEAAVSRPAMRGAMREEDPRAAASRRAAEIMQHLGGLDEGTDDFYIEPHKIPDGWSYEWKRKTIYNQEDPAYQVQLARTGWEAVPASRHPEMMPVNGSWQTIERKGMQLMMRPKVITEQFRNIDHRNAKEQVKHKEAQLGSAPEGQFGRDHAQVKPKISKGYEPMPVPQD